MLMNLLLIGIPITFLSVVVALGFISNKQYHDRQDNAFQKHVEGLNSILKNALK